MQRRRRWRRHTPDAAATTRGRSAIKRAGCAVIACAAAVPLAAAVHSEMHLARVYTSPDWTSEFTQFYRLEECQYRAIRSAVPRGAPIYVTNPDLARAQRLAELSILWAEPEEKISRADWDLTMSDATLAEYLHHRHPRYLTYRYCPGLLLSVENLAKARHSAVPGPARRGRKSRRDRQL
jgi:hypothetical protein